MNKYNEKSNNPEIADLHNYNRISKDYSSFTITSPEFQDQPPPDIPPPAYSSSFDYSSSFNNDTVICDKSHVVI